MMEYPFPPQVEDARTFVEVVAATLKGQLVEVYIGDTYEQIQKTDSTENINSVIVGEVIAGYHDCLVLSCFWATEDKEIKKGNLVFLNGWSIKGICPLDGHGTLNDVFTDIKFFKKVKK